MIRAPEGPRRSQGSQDAQGRAKIVWGCCLEASYQRPQRRMTLVVCPASLAATWLPLALPGSPWPSPGSSWLFPAPPGSSWLPLAPSPGSSWLLLLAPPVPPGSSSWLLLALPGSSWFLLASPGSSWLLLALPGSSWLPYIYIYIYASFNLI